MSAIAEKQRGGTSTLISKTVISVWSMGQLVGQLFSVTSEVDTDPDVFRSRSLEQKVLDILDEPPAK
jgi:hypothetical protein